MSIWVQLIAARVTDLVRPLDCDGRTRSKDVIERATRNYARRGAAGDLRDLISEARRLADDIRLRTGHDHTDAEWQEVEGYLHPSLPVEAREKYLVQNLARLIVSIARQIDSMETELLTLDARAA